jgi:hypothetical protein
MEIDDLNKDYKKQDRKFKRAKRVLNQTLTNPVTTQALKKLKTKTPEQSDLSFLSEESESEPIGPAYNTRQALHTKLNTAQIGKGWITFK